MSSLPDKIDTNLVGNCVLCSDITEEGVSTSDIFSSNFTDFPFLQAGDCLCISCAAAFKTAKIRRSNWIITSDQYQQLKWDKFIPAITELLNNPEVYELPWSAFVTPNYKKHGWVAAINAVNYSTTQFQIIFGKTLAHYTRDSFDTIVNLVNSLMPVFGKTRLYTLDVTPYTLEVLYAHNLYTKYQEATNYIGNPSWDLIVNCTPSVKKLLTPETD